MLQNHMLFQLLLAINHNLSLNSGDIRVRPVLMLNKQICIKNRYQGTGYSNRNGTGSGF